MSKLSKQIAENTNGARGGIPRGKGYIKPAHRAVLARMTQGMRITPAMIASGYTPSSASQANKLQRSKSWQLLMEEQIPESLLAMRHNELLNKRILETKIIGRGKNQRIEIVDLGPDVQAVKAGLEMAYKIRGKFKDEVKASDKPTQVYNLFYQPNVQASIRTFEDSLKNAITHGGIATIIDAVPSDDDADATEPSADGGGGDAGDQALDAGGGDTDGHGGEGSRSVEGEQGAQ